MSIEAPIAGYQVAEGEAPINPTGNQTLRLSTPLVINPTGNDPHRLLTPLVEHALLVFYV